MEKGSTKQKIPDAAQLCLPISVWVNLCERVPKRDGAVMELIKRHEWQFIKMYVTGTI